MSETIVRAGEGDLDRPVVDLTEDVLDPAVFADVARMMEYLSATPHAVAVAAPQLGIRRRLYVVKDSMQVFHNPSLEHIGTKTSTKREGCLSLYPDQYMVTRAKAVRVRALDVLGEQLDFVAHGQEARIHQHEYDHLDGILISNRGHWVV